MRAKKVCGHYDGRILLGTLNRQVYDNIFQLLNAKPGRDRPLLFNDSDRWLEQDIEVLANDLASNGQIVSAVEPILTSFDQHFEVGQ